MITKNYDKILLLLLIDLCACNYYFGQLDSAWQIKPKVIISGFVDVFYIYDCNDPATNYRQTFLYNHNRHNEFNLNLGYVKIAIENPKYRSNFALQAGTYVNDNYITEPNTLKNIYEANAGFSISKKNRLWLDAGVFGSHIGFESAINSDNWTMTRSILAENSPYYLAGAKTTFKPNEKWEMAVLILNGWQRIQKVQGNSLPSFGSQLKYLRSDKLTINWSTFIGSNEPDNMRKMRYFSNFYAQSQLNNRIGIILGFDAGMQQINKFSKSYHTWFSPVFITQMKIKESWKTALRFEYYQDTKGVIIPITTTNGFQTTGISWNLDFSPVPNFLWRLETRWFNSRDKLFQRGNEMVRDNIFLGTSISVKF